MGAWGAGSFANDDALDWLAGLEQAEDEQFLIDALIAAADEPGYLEVDGASNAIAAAEVVAALAGRPASDLPETAVTWARAHPTPNLDSLIRLSLRSLDRIARDSELASLWAEGGAELWLITIADLRARIGAAPSPRGA